MKNRGVLISGGGVAGYTLAYWLHRYGFRPTVIERGAHDQTDGYGIEFVGTGWDIADKMGLIPMLERSRIVVEDTLIKNVRGDSKAEVDLGVLYGEPGAASKTIALDRSHLIRALYSAVENDVEVRYSTSMAKIETGPESAGCRCRPGLSRLCRCSETSPHG